MLFAAPLPGGNAVFHRVQYAQVLCVESELPAQGSWVVLAFASTSRVGVGFGVRASDLL